MRYLLWTVGLPMGASWFAWILVRQSDLPVFWPIVVQAVVVTWTLPCMWLDDARSRAAIVRLLESRRRRIEARTR